VPRQVGDVSANGVRATPIPSPPFPSYHPARASPAPPGHPLVPHQATARTCSRRIVRRADSRAESAALINAPMRIPRKSKVARSRECFDLGKRDDANGERVTRCQPLARGSNYSRRPERAMGRMIVIAAITGPIYEWN